MVTHNKYVTREADGKQRDRRYEKERHTDTVSGERQREIGKKKAQKEKPEKAGEALMRKEGRKEKLSHEHNNYIAPTPTKSIC